MGTAKRKQAASTGRTHWLRGDRVRGLREARSWSQTDLAVELGMFQNRISEVERGLRDVSGDTLVRFVVGLNTSADYLLGLTDSPERRK